MDWGERARETIARVHGGLPLDAPLAERTAAVDAAYPFGIRDHHPYKIWLRERRAYLSKFGYQPKRQPIPESPMERMMRRARAAQREDHE